jgi:uncharacterized protein YggE
MVLVASLALGASAAAGAESGRGTVSGAGTTVVKCPPTMLRVQVQLAGRGKSLEDALMKLKQRRTAAVALLERLKADKAAIESTTPAVAGTNTSDSQRRRQMEQLIRQRMKNAKTGGKPFKMPQIVTVACMVSAQWPLDPAGDAEQWLLTAEKLKEKIKEADLSGVKDKGVDKEGLSAEEQELLEEAEGDDSSRFDSSDSQDGDGQSPIVLFVGAISPEARAKAMAEAFQSAKADAAAAVQAAGARLGPLVELNSDDGAAERSIEFYNVRRNRYNGESQLSPGRGLGPNESSSPDPATVQFHFTVRAQFALEKAADAEKK